MPGQLSVEKRRISYAEFRDIYKKIEALAKEFRLTETDIIRLATREFVERCEKELPKKELPKKERGSDIRKLVRGH
jgi:hypothetical protein